MTTTAIRTATVAAVAALSLTTATGTAHAETGDAPTPLGSVPGEVLGSVAPLVAPIAQSVNDPLVFLAGSVFMTYCSIATATNPTACA